MKKRSLFIGAILIIAGLSMFFIESHTVQQECFNQYTFTQDKHNRDDNSRRLFDIYAVSTEYAHYEIEITDEVDEVTAAKLVKIIERDIRKAYKYLEALEYTKPTILVANWQLVSPDILIDCYNIDNMAVISKDSVYSGDYLAAVLSAGYGINQYWLSYGIAGLISNRLDFDIDISKYYSKQINISTLDLFGSRFFGNIEGYKKQPTVLTSIELAKYIQANYGTDAIIALVSHSSTLDMNAVKNEWLESIGVTNEYYSPYEDQFNDYIITPYLHYDILIQSDFADYRLSMSEYGYVLGDSDGIQKFLYKNKMGIAEIKDIINATSQAELMNLDRKIIYEIQNATYRQDNNYYKIGTDIINLSSYAVEYAHIHEAIHFYSPYNVPDMDYHYLFSIFVEGFTGYMTTKVTNEYSVVESRMGDYEDIQRYAYALIDINESDCDGTSIFPYLLYSENAERRLLDYYEKHGGTIEDKDNFDRALFMDAISYAILNTWGGNVYPRNAADTFWVYPVYESFVGFLAEEYSLDHVIMTLNDTGNIENIFGKSVNELFNEWLVYLNR